MTPREYMAARLKLLDEGGVLTGTVDEHLERHEQAQEDLKRLRQENSDARQPKV
jgi:hypothetical protein